MLTTVVDTESMVSAKKSSRSTMQQLAPYMGLGLQLAAAMVAFGAFGWWLDSRFDTSPWLLIVGLLLGATGGMIHLVRTAVRSGKKGGPSPADTGARGSTQGSD
jgi:F0F1-type ATP synthase assembly protein I